MFSTSVQPSIVSLFSSTGSDPLNIFSTHTDPALPSDSIVHLLRDFSSNPPPPTPALPISPPTLYQRDDTQTLGYSLDQTVLHIQSPTLPTTYIHCPPLQHFSGSLIKDGRTEDLGMKHPWIHLQVRNMGREWSFEVGLVDLSGKQGIVRCSTFQRQLRLKLPTAPNAVPLLHLPLSFPTNSSYPLTAWSTIALHLPPLLPTFSSLALTASEAPDDEDIDESPWKTRTLIRAKSNLNVALPSGCYSHVRYVKVYATCRLRRIWFSEAGPTQTVPWEFELYAHSSHNAAIR